MPGGLNSQQPFPDQNVSKYRVGIRSKKWYWPLFVHLLCSPERHFVHMSLVLLLHTLQRWFVHTLEVAVLLYKRSDAYTTEPLDLLNFRRLVVKVYLMRNALPMPTALALPVVQHIPDNVRLDGIGHFNVASQSN